MGALKIGKALLIAWAAIASLGVAYMGIKSGLLIGELRTTKGDLQEAQSANDDWSDAAALLQSSLDTCESQFETVQNSAARDRNKRNAEIAALEQRLKETQSDLSQTLHDEATPELAACLPLSVPDRSLDRLRTAADNAARAGGDRAPGVDASAGG